MTSSRFADPAGALPPLAESALDLARLRPAGRGRARAAVPAILAAAAEQLPPGLEVPARAPVRITGTRTAVSVLGPRSAPTVVIKQPLSESGGRRLAAEGQVLGALRGDERLGSWRGLVPRRLATGPPEGPRWAVDSGVPGASALRRIADGGRARLQLGAVDAIGVLHRRTAHVVTVDDAALQRWVARPAAAVAAALPARAPEAETLRRLEGTLAEALHGRALPVGWIHGDLWLGNVLVSRDGTTTGIVDWDAAAPAEPAFHDVLHMLLYGRRLAHGSELGRVVCERLTDPEWTGGERELVRRHQATLSDHGLAERHVLALYWLRQAAAHLGQQDGRRSWRVRRWTARNVHPVLRVRWS